MTNVNIQVNVVRQNLQFNAKAVPTLSSKVVQLNDKAGEDGLLIKDSDGFVVAKIDSLGWIRTKKGVRKTANL